MALRGEGVIELVRCIRLQGGLELLFNGFQILSPKPAPPLIQSPEGSQNPREPKVKSITNKERIPVYRGARTG